MFRITNLIGLVHTDFFWKSKIVKCDISYEFSIDFSRFKKSTSFQNQPQQVNPNYISQYQTPPLPSKLNAPTQDIGFKWVNYVDVYSITIIIILLVSILCCMCFCGLFAWCTQRLSSDWRYSIWSDVRIKSCIFN